MLDPVTDLLIDDAFYVLCQFIDKMKDFFFAYIKQRNNMNHRFIDLLTIFGCLFGTQYFD